MKTKNLVFFKNLVFLISIILAIGVAAKIRRMYIGGQFSLLPCVYLFGEWRKLPFWSCGPDYPDEDCCEIKLPSTWSVDEQGTITNPGRISVGDDQEVTFLVDGDDVATIEWTESVSVGGNPFRMLIEFKGNDPTLQEIDKIIIYDPTLLDLIYIEEDGKETKLRDWEKKSEKIYR